MVQMEFVFAVSSEEGPQPVTSSEYSVPSVSPGCVHLGERMMVVVLRMMMRMIGRLERLPVPPA